ncbi:TfuA-like protein [Rhizobium sp. CNPSo 4039]|uniref:TfuA-like protein n=1 Tax=Rhizobium sp. CNPSo 4039 TaxID=3021409 RepID=UPI002550F3E6|nr:TfuA-like protein [Rhizobium sp. CNPSo 4039]MDK4717630.1 TfuA-like protein [Rhizobium sp. CNPSo 4039]
MKIVFVGPSIGGSRRMLQKRFPGLIFAPPAGCGDILRAVEYGAKAIGLIDGFFGDRPSVWHKEILFALSRGLMICGGASMGALRAVECQPFGMIGIGKIFTYYMDGKLTDDEAVALIHAPEELDWLPLSVPRVDYEATFERLSSLDLISANERERLLLTAGYIHYSRRTYRSIVAACAFLDEHRKRWLLAAIENWKVELKRADANLVIEWLDANEKAAPKSPWAFAATSHWEILRREMSQEQQTVRQPRLNGPGSAMDNDTYQRLTLNSPLAGV